MEKKLNQEISQNTINAFLFVLMLFALALVIYALVGLYSDNAACSASPLVYGADKLSKANNADLTCTCAFASKEGAPLLYVTKDRLELKWLYGGEKVVIK